MNFGTSWPTELIAFDSSSIGLSKGSLFIATNVYEWSLFKCDARSAAIKDIIDRYNRIVSECESDPSLRIAFDG